MEVEKQGGIQGLLFLADIHSSPGKKVLEGEKSIGELASGVRSAFFGAFAGAAPEKKLSRQQNEQEEEEEERERRNGAGRERGPW